MPAGAFEFSSENNALAERIVARYPEGRQASAILPLFDLAQRQCGGWLPHAAIEYVADYLGLPRIRAHEAATFYSMINLQPVGRHFVQICRTTPCWLCGSDALTDTCRRVAGCELGETSADGLLTLVEVECLGACCNAPMVQIDDHYYEDLTPESLEAVLEALRRGEVPATGSRTGRRGSEPAGGLTTLTEAAGD
jgi:NADH-quinone oxidoreductase subunit E